MPERAGRGRLEVAYYRRELGVRRRTMGPFDRNLLASLAAGETIESALERARRAFPGGSPSGEILSGWFAEWTRLGFFAGIGRAS